MKKRVLTCLSLLSLAIGLSILLFIYGFAPSKPEPVMTGFIGDEEYEPMKWGEIYPLQYESWLQTKEPRPANKSKYKKGWDTDKVIYDKLSEYPYMALLYKGWGFGIEYNEPRGHAYMLLDQVGIDQSRTKAGAACLTCKTPYINKFVKENGKDLFKMSYADVVKKIPEQHKSTGVACIDCHDNRTMGLRLLRWTIKGALEDIEKTNLSRQEMRSVVCAQCHVTYIITRDIDMKPTNVIFPWKESKWGDISVEDIIKQIKSDPANLEWNQNVTGFRVGFIRHPEFEFYTRDSTHWKAGVSCADCHMPYRWIGANKISDHNIMSPLKNDMRSCIQCHPESIEWLKEQVITIQDRVMALINRAGYATATVARLFQLAHDEQEKGKTIDKVLYHQARDFYLEALYRFIFLGGENSVGFHNPTEAGRIAGDAISFASKSESFLRQALTKANVEVPIVINLELYKYINNRGSKKLSFIPNQEFKDPSGIQDMLLPEKAKGF